VRRQHADVGIVDPISGWAMPVAAGDVLPAEDGREIPADAASGAGSATARMTTITIDQAVSSLSNVILSVLAARVLSERAFGLFGIVLLVAVTTAGITRALLGEPLLVHQKEARERPGEAMGTTLSLGAGIAAVVAVAGVVGLAFDRNIGTGLFVLAACTPLMLLQDLGRYLGFATHRPSRALQLDLTWLVLIIVAIGALHLGGAETLTWFLLGWAGTGALSGTLLLWQHRGQRMRFGFRWLRETWPFSWRYAVSYGANQGAVLVGSLALAGILGAATLGAVRGTLLLYGPLVQLQAAVTSAGVSEVSRFPVTSPEARRHLVRATSVTTAAALLGLLIVTSLPDRVGVNILGDTWSGAKVLLAPAGFQMVGLALTSGTRSSLLGWRALRTTLRMDVITSITVFSLTVGGAIVGGAETAFWALAIGQGTLTLVWFAVYADHRRRAASGSPPTAPPTPGTGPSTGWAR
jgi:O-antigen/teichoic acid export membrane protein